MKFPRILVKLPNWIGDAVMAGPLVAALRAHWPAGHLALLARVKVREVAERLPGADEVVGEPAGLGALTRLAAAGAWDLAVSLSSTLSAPVAFAAARIPVRVAFAGGGRGAFLTHAVPPPPRSLHQVEHYLALGAPVGAFRPAAPALAWLIRPGDDAEAGRFLARTAPAGERLVAIAPGATFGPAKRWFASRWAALGDRLALERGVRVTIVGGAEERPVAARIARLMARRPVDATGALTLGATAALLRTCTGFVSNDSGLMHVGAAVGVPTVGLFGSSNPHWTRPYGPAHAALWGRVPCAPCYRRTCVPGRGYACLDALTVDRVLRAIPEAVPGA